MVKKDESSNVGDNPYNFLNVKKNIINDLVYFKKRIKITLAPNISEICYGRTVGYKINKIKLEKNEKFRQQN